MENHGCYYELCLFGANDTTANPLCMINKFFNTNIAAQRDNIVSDMQYIHDCFPPERWEEQFQWAARKYQLNLPSV